MISDPASATMADHDRHSLDTLPVELLTEISSYLRPPHCETYPYGVSQKHLSCLSRTCRRLRDVCQPLLFDHYHRETRSPRPLFSFLKTLDARPDLAKCVTSLGFLDPIPGRADSLSDENRQFVESCIAKLGLPPLPADWHNYLAVERRLLAAELVVVSCPNIKALSVPMNPEWRVSVLASLPKDFVFAKLKKLDICPYYISGDHYAIEYRKISGLLHASPNLEHLRLPSIEMFHPGKAQVPLLEKLTELDLGEGAPSPYFLNCALKAYPNLQKFQLHWVDTDGYDEDSDEWSSLDGWRTLQHVRSSVREVIFETVLEFRHDNNLEEDISTLRHFARLEILKVNGIALDALYSAWMHHNRFARMEQFVYQVFPSTVKELTFWDPAAWLIEAVRLLAREAARGKYPRLAKITIGLSEHMDGYGFDVVPWVREETTVRREFDRSTIELCMELPPPALFG